MQTQQADINHLELANIRLFELKAQVTTEDRRSLPNDLKIDPATLSAYLNKKGKNLDTAIALLDFFTERIAAREKKLAKAS